MTNRRRRSWLKPAMKPVMVVAVMLLLGGCGLTHQSTPLGGPIGAGRMLIGSKLDEAALRRRAEADSFPTAAEAGLEQKAAADAKD